MISVILLGAGNVASHLYKVFHNSDTITVTQWYNRHIDKISTFKNEVEITDDLSALKRADIYIIAVSDDAIATVSEALPFQDRFVVHTSGTASLYDIDAKHRRGVFYPLQTFTKGAEVDFSNIPLCIEGLKKSDFKLLKRLAEGIGSKDYKVSTEQRKRLHIAAVFANNFTNQMYRIAHEITEANQIEFEILKPLILETAKKIQTMSPYMAQTGPAVRGDKKTAKQHLNLIENPQHKAIYKLLTESINDTHGRKKL
ncbi:conserved hypothetical protein (DUF2520) [Formosa agariphila KMM 3901]|uniref:DUF2520 domain-containing protein n=1 Tax=Formosa agariphila (strain DSM 15362 / KCTC 12365 / LMG 23005 / KMM 3901 / M-2Alg 35-1) TaxID=1347342 RepID=T2KKP1_FORAG|nr:Rossmann-like and DUF2520 domain-containing protein [Formosa agariphila]CDF79013.1 conserved hypothetical protein (DUF2520) [Formosa agariphila KMM 3901]